MVNLLIAIIAGVAIAGTLYNMVRTFTRRF